jgi:multiple sugar transport system permease protein
MVERSPFSLVSGLQAALLLGVFGIIIFPIFWIAVTAFKLPRDVYEVSLIFPPTIDNFFAIFGPPWNLGWRLMNSLVVALVTVAIAIPLAALAAYGFSRFAYAWKRGLFFLILATQFIPAVVIVLPFYLMFRDLGLLDSRMALIIVNLAIVTPFAVWMLKGFFDAVPIECDEAALIDGASHLRILWSVVAPMALPGIIVAAVFSFILAWNEFIFALILTRSNAVTLQIGIINFRTERGDIWELMAASGFIITIPAFIATLAIQKHFAGGLNSGAVK